MNWFDYILLVFGVSWICIGMYRRYAVEKGILDTPNKRSSHNAPTPRGGGIIFVGGTIVLLSILYYYHFLDLNQISYFIPASCIGILGYIDDRIGLSSSSRFFIHFVCAIGFLFLIKEGGFVLQNWINLPLPINFLILSVAIVWSINLFNFMDGIDGIAASEAIFCLVSGGFIFHQAQAYEFATLIWGIAAILGAFLTWNWPMAKIFMGDAGSGFLGMLIATFALLSYKFFNVPIMVWGILTSLFWYDATVTLVRRILAKEKWYAPHRSHAYQRMVQYGWSHQKVLICTLLINMVLSSLALWAYHHPNFIPAALTLALLFLTCLYIMVEIAKPMYGTWHSGSKQINQNTN